MTVAETIFVQLGGGRFKAMTGSKQFIEDGDALKMTLAGNRSKANRLTVTLSDSDDYTMLFWRYERPSFSKGIFKGEKISEVAKFDGVYCDQLQDLFTQVTGLYTRL